MKRCCQAPRVADCRRMLVIEVFMQGLLNALGCGPKAADNSQTAGGTRAQAKVSAKAPDETIVSARARSAMRAIDALPADRERACAALLIVKGCSVKAQCASQLSDRERRFNRLQAVCTVDDAMACELHAYASAQSTASAWVQHAWTVSFKTARWPECRDAEGRTPLMMAACSMYHAAVSLLLEKGADALTTDSAGRTALHWLAASEGPTDRGAVDACNAISDKLVQEGVQVRDSQV